MGKRGDDSKGKKEKMGISEGELEEGRERRGREVLEERKGADWREKGRAGGGRGLKGREGELMG